MGADVGGDCVLHPFGVKEQKINKNSLSFKGKFFPPQDNFWLGGGLHIICNKLNFEQFLMITLKYQLPS